MTDDEERKLKGMLLMADIGNKAADTAYKLGLLKYEPWKVVVGAFAAGGALVAGTATAMGLILHALGKL